MPATTVLLAGMPSGLRTVVGVTETQRESGAAEMRRTWNGTARILKPSYARVWDVTLSNSGSRVWLPDIQALVPGAAVTLHSTVWWSVRFPAGATEAILDRDPVPGTVHGRDDIDETVRIAAGVLGRRVTIGGRAGTSRVFYRPILQCLVVSFEGGGSATGLEQNWTLELAEVAP